MRGGARAGAGRKAVDSLPRDVDVSSRVSEEIAKAALEIGSGSISAGIRIMLTAYVSGSTQRPAKSVKSISKKKPPVREVVPTHSPEGIRYNLQTRMRLESEAEDRYQKTLALFTNN